MNFEISDGIYKLKIVRRLPVIVVEKYVWRQRLDSDYERLSSDDYAITYVSLVEDWESVGVLTFDDVIQETFDLTFKEELYNLLDRLWLTKSQKDEFVELVKRSI